MSGSADDVAMEAGRMITLGDPDGVLVASEGYIDIFAIAGAESSAAGARHHLMRVPEGIPFFGAPTPPDGVERFVAVPGIGADVVEATRADWIEAQEDEDVEDLVEALAGAVRDWSAEPLQSQAPRQQTRLVPDETVRAESGASLGCDHGAVLVEINKGRLRYLGAAGAVAVEDARLMIGSRAWLIADGEVEADVFDTDVIDELDLAVDAFAEFQRLHLLAACARRLEDEERAPERLRQRVRVIETLQESGMLRMRRLLDPTASADTAPKESREALLMAMRMVAAQQGLTLADADQGDEGSNATGTSLIQSTADASGFRLRSVTLSGQWWLTDSGPMLAFRAEDDAPVVLLPGRGKTYRLLDPVSGRDETVDGRAAAGLKPYAYFFYRPFAHEPIGMGGLLTFGLRGQSRHLVPALALSGVIAVVAMLVPLVASLVVDQVIPSAQTSILLQLGLILGAAAVIESLFSVARGFLLLRVQNAMEHDIQAAVWDRVLGLPIAFFRDFSVGDLAMRVNAINMVFRMLSVSTLTGLVGGLFMLLNFVVLFSFNVILALVALALVLAAIGFLWLSWHMTHHRLESLIPSQKKIMALVFQLVQGVAKLRSTASESRAFGVWSGEFAGFRAIRLVILTLQTQQKVFFAGYQHFGVLIMFLAVAALIGEQAAGALSAGQFVGFWSAFSAMFLGALSAFEIAIGLFIAPLMFKMAQPILEALPETGTGKVDPGPLGGSIEVSQVSFAYPDGDPVLDDVSFSIPAGSFTAVVGASGSGKSTLLRLLLAFDEPAGGAILYDDKNLHDLDLRKLRRQFGVVLQNSPLMPGDIFSNIVGVTGAGIDEAWAAARMAGLEDDIRAMPMGMHTAIGEGTSTLSGGQRQRILLARALIGDPRVVFLDEATSALDNASQAQVAETLLRMKATRVVIAHRLTTIVDADQIIVLDQGKLAQVGTYDELMENRKGIFYGLAKRQAMEDPEQGDDE